VPGVSPVIAAFEVRGVVDDMLRSDLDAPGKQRTRRSFYNTRPPARLSRIATASRLQEDRR
jgi:hypothetical protein